MLTVDEEIYRLTPAFVIATVDKFARQPAKARPRPCWLCRPPLRSTRATYTRPCRLHHHHEPPGHRQSPGGHGAPGRAAAPPDLIIQDELHLITGALGTAVGLFEVAVETLASWELPDGKPVRPLIVASTATVRNAEDQVRGLYGRKVEMFPPQVLDVADTYFRGSSRLPRRHPVGAISASALGVRLSSAEIRVSEVLLSAGQLLLTAVGLPQTRT